ncbi:MAG: hypothetical protein OHK0017_13650 [Patescibacteria group bacterium]
MLEQKVKNVKPKSGVDKKKLLQSYLDDTELFLLQYFKEKADEEKVRDAENEIIILEYEEKVKDFLSQIPAGKIVKIKYNDPQSGRFDVYEIVPSNLGNVNYPIQDAQFMLFEIHDKTPVSFVSQGNTKRSPVYSHIKSEFGNFFDYKDIVKKLAFLLYSQHHYKLIYDEPSDLYKNFIPKENKESEVNPAQTAISS